MRNCSSAKRFPPCRIDITFHGRHLPEVPSDVPFVERFSTLLFIQIDVLELI